MTLADIAALVGIWWLCALVMSTRPARASHGSTGEGRVPGMADISIKTRKRDRKPITFTLGDDDYVYSFTPPKNAYMMMPLLSPDDDETEEQRAMNMTKRVFDWLGVGLSEDDVKKIVARLEDPKDDLDIEFLGDLIQQISEMVAGRPTT